MSGFDIEVLAVISEPEMIPLCDRFHVKYIMHENFPLGLKKNAGLQEAKKFDFDFMMEIGSDDLILDDLFESYKKFFVKYDFFGINDAAYINAENLDCCRLQSPAVFGAGRVISRKALELVNFNIWSKQQKGMDKVGINVLYAAGVKYWQIPPIDYPLVVDIKSPVNIWPFRDFKKLGVRYDINEIYSRISEQEVNAIKCLPHMYQSADLIEK